MPLRLPSSLLRLVARSGHVIGAALLVAALCVAALPVAALPVAAAPVAPAAPDSSVPASAAPPAAAPAPAAAAPATWRVDYFHTGGPGLDEVFSLDRVVVEPLPWPGSPGGRVDTTGFGVYRFEVRKTSADDASVLFSRGFSPLFAEWQTTAEAAQRHRTFHESLRFPAPAGPAILVVLRRNDDQVTFREIWRLALDPADMFLDPSPPAVQELVEIEVHGAPAEKVDLLLLGDGYTAEECARDFPADGKRMAAALFRHQPFARRRTDFNVWGLCPPSPESGVSRPSTGRHVRTPVGTTYDIFGSERYVLSYDNRVWRDVAARAPYEFVVMLVNMETYGGGGLYNQYSTAAVDNDWADYLFVHELGHHFAALADEYYTSPVAYQPPEVVVEPWEPNATALLDPAALKWKDLVTPGTPIPTPWPKEAFEEHAQAIQQRRQEIRARDLPESVMSELFREQQAFDTALLSGAEHAGEVGAFQGANYDARAYYRPQADCVMFTRDEVDFCAVCQRAIETVIDLHTAD